VEDLVNVLNTVFKIHFIKLNYLQNTLNSVIYLMF